MLSRLFAGGGGRESRSLSFQDVWGAGQEWTGSGSYSGSDALALSAVVGCVRLRANLISQLPLTAFRLVDGLPSELPVQPGLVVSPGGPDVVRSTWLAQMSLSRDLFGNAVGLVTGRGPRDTPTMVDWVHPDRVRFEQSDGRLLVWLDESRVSSGDVVLVPSVVLPGSPVGVAPLESAGLVELGLMARDFGRDWFQNGAVPSQVIYSDDELTAEQAAGVKRSVRRSWRRRQPAVLGSGLRLESMPADSDSQSPLATMRHVQVDVCQCFGVPPEAIGIASSGQSVTYTNREQQMASMLVGGLNADLVTVQETLSALLPEGEYVRFNTGALLRSDLATRYEAYQKALASEFMTVDEVRALEELPPLDAPGDGKSEARQLSLVEAVQKVYLGVDKVITSDEARQMLNDMGAGLDVPGPQLGDM
jgi:HK97 family phage portal protein